MQFREFIEQLLGSKVKIKLLRHIIAEEAITSEREIARLIGASPGAVNKTLKEFQNLNLLTPMRVGNVIIWQLNKDSYAYNYLQSFFYKIKSHEQPIQDLKEKIKSLNHLAYVKKAIIFGSIAEGRELPDSDIDLFILVTNEEDRKNILSWINSLNDVCLHKYGNRLSAHIFTIKDLKNPKNKKFLENVKNGIVVIEK